MSKMSKAVAQKREEKSLRLESSVENFMGGTSYKINPLDTLKMITASSIFGEPAYYRSSKSSPATYGEDLLVRGYTILSGIAEDRATTEDIMESAIDAALDYNFKETLEWAVSLRQEYYMRLNPQVIMVRAAMHPKRKEFTEENPGMFDYFNQLVMQRSDEPMSQMAYYMFKNEGEKNNIPSILKRSWSKKISGLGRYTINKYKNHEIGMINAVRICHAHSAVIDELMRTGTLEMREDGKTWEQLKSEGMNWDEILNTCSMGHMAMLRNIRGVFAEIDDLDKCKKYMQKIKDTVSDAKQFPFRYYSAIKAVSASDCHHKAFIIDALEECMDIALANYPKLKGKTMCLSDNSGSAWGAFNSEYGSVTVAEIDNLSSVITAACSEDGYVGKFGDTLQTYPISKRHGILNQSEEISEPRYNDVGGNTEGGIWEFFYDAIRNNKHYDNIFIYSDQQAGHGGLYGTRDHMSEYTKMGYASPYRRSNINVFKLIQDYRKKVNPKVNVFCIQTAGYNNVLIPEMAYRTAIMYGWTGREAEFAQKYIQLWDEVDNRNKMTDKS